VLIFMHRSASVFGLRVSTFLVRPIRAPISAPQFTPTHLTPAAQAIEALVLSNEAGASSSALSQPFVIDDARLDEDPAGLTPTSRKKKRFGVRR
jgi:hypothetical protein